MDSIAMRMMIFTILNITIELCRGSSEEFRLLRHLINPDRYDVNVRPVKHINHSVTVYIDMDLNQLIDLDEVNQVLTLKVWLRMKWIDTNLEWNKEDYGGLEEIRIKQEKLWKPDITLYQDVSLFNQETERYFPAKVRYTGEVQFNAPKILKTSCLLDVKYFPWDQQICPLKFGSWTYNIDQLDIFNGTASGETANYITNGEWLLAGFPVRRRIADYNSGSLYSEVIFYTIINRKPLYYLFNLVLPCAFITATTLLVFYLPPDSGEKVSLGVTVLLALTVFLLLVAESMPAQSTSIPLMASYFASNIVLLAISTALTVVVLNIHHRGIFGNKVPSWVRTVVLNWLATFLLLKSKVKRNTEEGNSNSNNNLFLNGNIRNNAFSNSAYQEDDVHSDTQPPLSEKGPQEHTDHLLYNILQSLKELKTVSWESKEQEECKREWMLVAMVLDRFFLIIFALLIVGISIGILLSHPRYNLDAESLV